MLLDSAVEFAVHSQAGLDAGRADQIGADTGAAPLPMHHRYADGQVHRRARDASIRRRQGRVGA